MIACEKNRTHSVYLLDATEYESFGRIPPLANICYTCSMFIQYGYLNLFTNISMRRKFQPQHHFIFTTKFSVTPGNTHR